MYGVRADLLLQRFVGDALFNVAIGVDGVHFGFGRAGNISVYGRWELYGLSGELIDHAQKNSVRECYRIHVVLNEDVTGYEIDPPRSFTLTFLSGRRLIIYDNMQRYESFQIQPDNIIV